MNNIKLAIVGSRTFDNYDELNIMINKIIKENNYNISLIISGGAKGADTFAEQYAKENNIETLIFPAEWKKYGRRAGYLRNVDIIKNCDICIAFWDGFSGGTAHDLELCYEYKKKCFIYNFIRKTLTILK